MKKRILCWTT